MLVLGQDEKAKYPFLADAGEYLKDKGFSLAQQQLISQNSMGECKLELVIVGDGSLEDELIALASELNVLSQVDFVGAVENNQVADYINKMDIFVVPSRIESFGVAAIEALGCERPCIVANTGGLPEVILNGETGIVVEAESAKAIADAIVYFINNKAAVIEMGHKGRESVNEKYLESAALDIMLNLYHQFEQKNVN